MAVQASLLMSQHTSDGRTKDVLYLFVMGIVWLLMAALVQPLGNFPLNDDWVYALAVKSVVETGYFQFPSPSMANVGPQVYWGALFSLPFGFSFTALRISTLVLGFIGVVALYGLLRQFKVDAKTSLFGASTLAVNPLYFGLANTFMTDVPFITLVLVALYFLVRGLQQDSTLHITLGLIVIYLAILIRQFSLVVLIGFALAYPIKKGFTLANIAKVAGLIILGVLLHVGYQYWLASSGRLAVFDKHTIPVLNPPTITNSTKKATVSLIYVGFFVLPFIAAIWSPKIHRMTGKSKYVWAAIWAYVVLLLGFLWFDDHRLPLLDNILMNSGIGPLTIRDVFNLKLNVPTIPDSALFVWNVVTFFSVLAAGISLYLISLATYQAWLKYSSTQTRAEAAPYALLVAMSFIYLAILLVVVGRFTLFDRYLLIFLPLVVLLIAAAKYTQTDVQKSRSVVPIVVLVLYAAFSVGATHDYLDWNRTRWVALHDLVNVNNISPQKIDGGYEFNGWFLYDKNYKQSRTKSWWWVVDDEYVLAAGPLPGYTEVKRYPVNRWLNLTASDIIVLRRMP